ncbi:15-hydroxyprostaglandin dehydrogenase [NAD(+)]-like [Galleria mellonella]|uniref:15-hydroxyprostaglandin dehydrogenase [NAD(+)]-like n=1 Tax=Galleria mellonella TaxID=7137 RepID=A0A6J1WH30_GALME|nr:15-hydroxyprostaglandin dehydrogenase [NAD(+)]-like [Galleria mellonella]
MSRDLSNKTAVITGGAQGIGLAIATSFLKKGAKIVILLDLEEKTGVEAANTLNSEYGENKAVFIKCDVTADLEAVSKLIFDTYKTVDILVNNAGVVCEHDPRKCIAVNTTAVIEWTLKFWEHMRKDKGGIGGTILNTASIYSYRIDPFCPIYKASKFAVLGFTKSLGLDYHYDKTGIRIVAICPGFTMTKIVTAKGKDEQLQRDFEAFVRTNIWQNADVVGLAAVQVFESADSGTAWAVEGGVLEKV